MISNRLSLRPILSRTANLRAWRGLAFATSAVALATPSALAQNKSATSSDTAYVLPLNPSVDATTAILTVGNSVNNKADGTPYRMVGIPDGLGAFDNGDGTFTVLMNHEINGTEGVVREHGQRGSFVSKYIVRKDNLSVVRGSDLFQQVALYNVATGTFNAPGKTALISRLCSADLPPLSAFFNDGVGYNGRIFMNGEEIGPEGRAFGSVVTGPEAGTSYELPRLGKFSWENSVANPATGGNTVVMGTDDATPGQVYCYVGTKTNQGNAVERAGLNNGLLYGIKVTGFAQEDNAAATTRTGGIPSGTAFTLAPLGDVSAMTGAAQQAASTALGVTEFLRPEDGSWDPKNPNHFYFVTTDRFDTTKTGQGTQVARTRLWRLRFTDINNPTLGGQIDQLLDGTGDYQMFDNMTVDNFGRILLQEDPGGQAYTARVHQYNIATGQVTPLLEFDRARFGGLTPSSTGGAPTVQAPTAPFNNDEESSGIIDISDIMGRGTYLFDVQAHYSTGDVETVQGGQLLVLSAPTPDAALDLDASAAGLSFDTTFSEDGAPVAIGDTDLSVSAGRNPVLTNATVTLTNVLDGAAEVLAANVGTTGLTATYTNNGTTGVLSISGSGSAAVYRQVLASVTYSNSSPTPNITARTVTATVGDGTLTSAVATSTIAIALVNDAPTVSGIANVQMSEDSTAALARFSVGDIDSNVAGLSITATSSDTALIPNAGLVAGGSGADRTLAITPAANRSGQATVTVRVSDGTASAATTFIVFVSAVNDAPVATAQTLTTPEDTGLNITLAATDIDSTSFTFTLVAQPRNGTLSGSGASLRYTPNRDFVGADSFTFKANDGAVDSAVATVNITVGGVNDAPVARADSATTGEDTPVAIQVLANDSDVETSALFISGVDIAGTRGTVGIAVDRRSVVFSPAAGFGGSTGFGYTVSDGTATATARVTVQVAARNRAPIAVNDAYTAPTAGARVLVVPASRGVLANDTDTEGATLRADLLSTPRHGRLRMSGDGAFIYSPSSSFSGVDTFTYRVDDGRAPGNIGTVSITVQAPRDVTKPFVAFLGGAQISARSLPTPRGIAADRYAVGRTLVISSGLREVVILLQRPDGQYWNGRAFQSARFELATRLSGRIFSLQAAVPTGSMAPAGNYRFTALARDNAGNAEITLQNVLISSVASG